MAWIVSDILTLAQYFSTTQQQVLLYNQGHCPHCGQAGLWNHGHYERKADRTRGANKSLNPILIQRFICKHCRRTCSVLPECIPPKRWYLWDMQQIALWMLLAGNSLSACAKKIIPSRHTIKRWKTRLKEQFHLHKDVLCDQFVELGRTTDFRDFWQTFFKNNHLSKAMRLCHVAGVPIP